MRFKVHLFAIALLLVYGFTTPTDTATLRTYFEKGRSQKTYAEQLKQVTALQDKAIVKAYHGTAWTLLAKHHSNPYKKLEYLKTGLNTINSAVLMDAADIEIRFLRFAVETNIPAIVSFTSHIESDKTMLLNNLKNTHTYFSTIKAYLMASPKLSPEEKKKLP